jgi:hypothetical protein
MRIAVIKVWYDCTCSGNNVVVTDLQLSFIVSQDNQAAVSGTAVFSVESVRPAAN